MPTAIYNITYQQNANYEQQFTFYAPNEVAGASAVPIDFSGHTARMQVRDLVESEIVMVELTTENGMISLDDEGRVVLSIEVADAADLIDEGVYDLFVTSGATGKPEKIMMGLFRFEPAVTRD